MLLKLEAAESVPLDMELSNSGTAESVLLNTQAATTNSFIHNDLCTGKYGLRPRSEKTKNHFKMLADERFGGFDAYGCAKPKRRRRKSTKTAESASSIRERIRCEKYNKAFKNLREVMHQNTEEGKRLSKLATLRLAISHIAHLSSVLCDKEKLNEEPDKNTPPGPLKTRG